MEFFGICGIAAIISASLLVFSGREKELSAIISSLVFVCVFVYAITRVEEFWSLCRSFFSYAEGSVPLVSLFKVGGVALAGAVSSSVCEEVGQKGVARTLEVLSVIEILYISFPMCQEMIEKLVKIFGG